MHIFCDLDGVLVDFEGGFLQIHGRAHNSVPEGVMWKMIRDKEGHWALLPPMPDAQQLWDFIRPHKPTILTGCPTTGHELAVDGKRLWCLNNLTPDTKVITCLSRNKPQHMLAPGDVLIDDMEKNIKRWTDAGGIGILHTSAAKTIKELEKLFAQ